MRLLFLLTLLGGTGQAQTTDPAAIATLRQETLPAFKQRTTTAKERTKSAEAFFANKGDLQSAWPELVGAPLNEPGYLTGRLQALQARDEARALERIAPSPAGLSKSQEAQRVKALNGAIEAEIRADALERQLLSALVAGLKRAPDLQAVSIEPQRSVWRTLERIPAALDPGTPEHTEAVEKARQAGEQEVILNRYLQAAYQVMTVPGDLSLARLVRGDLTRMEGRSELERQAAGDRIARALPLLPDDLAVDAQILIDGLNEEALAAELIALDDEEAAAIAEGLQPLSEEPDVAALEAAAEAADAAVAAAEAESAVLLAETAETPLQQRRQEIARKQIQILRIRAENAHTFFLQASEQEDARSVIAGAAQTQDVVDDAQRKAEEARIAAEAAGKEELQALIGNLQTLSAQMAEAETTRHDQVSTIIGQLQVEQLARQNDISEALQAPPALKTGELKTEYIQQINWIDGLRRQLLERERSAHSMAEKNASVRDNKLPAPDQIAEAAGNNRELTRDVQSAVEAVQDAMDERLNQAWRETDAVARMLRTARTDLRRIRNQLSRVEQISAERAAGIEPALQAAAELTDVPSMVTERYRTLQELQSWSLSNISRQILVFLIQSFNIVLVLLGWHVLRNQGADWVERMLRISQQVIPRSARQQRFDLWFDVDLTGLTARITPTIRPAADTLAAALIHASISEASPVLGIFTLLWLIRTLLALTPKLVDLLVVESADERFSLLQTSAEVHQLISRSARVVVWWWLLLTALHYVAYEVLRADMLDALLSSLTLLLVVALSMRELLRWGPTIRSHVIGISTTGWLAEWMTAPSSSSLMTIARAFAGLLYSAAHLTTQLTALLVEGRGGLSWVGSLIAQHSLKQLNEDCPPLTDAEEQAIHSAHSGIFLHEDLVVRIAEEHTRWRENQRGGMVALIGGSGTGKSMVLSRAQARLEQGDAAIRIVRPTGRLSDPDAVLRWLIDDLDLTLEGEPDWILLTRALRKLPPTVILIDDAHRLLLRSVGGFSALRRLINLMHATADQHFWVASFHQQSWSFLEGSAVPVSIDLFRTRLEIEPLSPARLADWLGSNTRAAGFDFDFDNLVAGAVLGADPVRSLERVQTAFWRRLADTSAGNPTVALLFWISSLRHPLHPELEVAEDPANAHLIPLDVVLYNPAFADTIDAMTDPELFVLASILIHDGLSVENLASSLNTTLGIIRSICRQLQTLEVLTLHDTEYRISPIWIPAVTRTLRQRHFLHNRG